VALWALPTFLGVILNNFCIIGYDVTGKIPKYDYSIPMLIFMCFGILAVVFALLLKAEDKKKGYGIESPNIIK
jgi:phosphotransferase system  glucose/maltose/N-acetylglucosamine-specific IIC component